MRRRIFLTLVAAALLGSSSAPDSAPCTGFSTTLDGVETGGSFSTGFVPALRSSALSAPEALEGMSAAAGTGVWMATGDGEDCTAAGGGAPSYGNSLGLMPRMATGRLPSAEDAAGTLGTREEVAPIDACCGNLCSHQAAARPTPAPTTNTPTIMARRDKRERGGRRSSPPPKSGSNPCSFS